MSRNDAAWRVSLLSSNELKTWLHRDLTQRDKLLLILATFDHPVEIRDITARAREAGLKIGSSWNPSATLRRTSGLAIKTPSGWEITDPGKQHLRNIGVSKISPAAVQVASDLRAQLEKIGNEDTKQFVEEAVKCYEAELYRSAVVMSWLAAVHVLYQDIIYKHLGVFNDLASTIDAKWKKAKTMDDLGRMKESDFLDRLAGISVLGKNVKEQLKICLDLRNACGHPNSMKIGANTVARHIEILLLNVFTVFI
jgi:hypothetical protein